MLLESELDYIADRLWEKQQAKKELPENVSCQFACEWLGIKQQALKRRLDAIGEKSHRMGKGQGIKSAWLQKLLTIY